ncbi:MAG: sugar phosphate isomerase/epimerase family protein [Thermoguttaceae bacterium]
MSKMSKLHPTHSLSSLFTIFLSVSLSVLVVSNITSLCAAEKGREKAQSVGTSESFHGPVGIQTYSLRNQLQKEGESALDYVKDQGFVEVEIGIDNHYGMSKEQMKDALAKRGLKPIAAHASYDVLLNDPQKAIDEAKFFGIKYVGVAWAPHQTPLDAKQTLELAANFNKIGQTLHEQGLMFFYHNHGYEFYPYKGNGKEDETLMDLLIQKTNPEFVTYEMDVLWTVHPGQDPVQLLQKYPNRWALMHLKDLAKGVKGDLSGGTDTKNDVALGSGQTDYPALLKAAQKVGVKHYFIEDESDRVLDQIPESLHYLESVRF